MPWMSIESAPFEQDLELAVIEADEDIHAVVFPCRRVVGGWTKTATGSRVELHPTHWRYWEKK
ncbi:hypothetical protein CO675_22210 [Bradyrhizobium sp. C9]|nr:hypothetical protein [Bradyrhizobium sp. C9]PDT75010.1 hypothetical protein CO675_22210 [Bradyrhizobium sp. C9]